MENALWLTRALPEWYFGAALTPLAGNYLTLIPAVGVLSALIGIVLGILGRQRQLLWFLILLLGSAALVATAGLLRGELADPFWLTALLYGFLAAETVGALFIIHRLKSARVAASAVGVFCLSYAYFATFIAAMAFTDDWI